VKEPTKLDHFKILSEYKVPSKNGMYDDLIVRFEYQEYKDYIVNGEIHISLDRLTKIGRLLSGGKSSSLALKVLLFGRRGIDVTFDKNTPPKRTKADEIIYLYFLKRHKFLYSILKKKEANFEKQNLLSATENEDNYYETDDDLDDDY